MGKTKLTINDRTVRNLLRFSEKAQEKALEEVRDKAKTLVPVDTGALRASIKVVKPSRVEAQEDYAAVVEERTPYLYPALRSINLVEIIKETFKREV